MRRLHNRLVAVLVTTSMLIPVLPQVTKMLDTHAASRQDDLEDLKEPASETRNLIERYSVDRGTLLRLAGGELISSRQARLKKFYGDWRSLLDKMDFNKLGQEDKIDYLLFRNHLDYESRQLEIQARALAETEALLPFAGLITTLDETRRRMELVDSPKAAAALSDISRQVEASQRRLESGLRSQGRGEGGSAIPNKVLANRAAVAVNSLRNILRGWYGFYDGYDPVFTWWASVPYRQADQSLQRYGSFLRERLLGFKSDESEGTLAGGAPGQTPNPARAAGGGGSGGGGGGGGGGNQQRGESEFRGRNAGQAQAGSSADIIGDPIGREALLTELAHEMIPYTPEGLIEIANQEFAWCEVEMKRASRDLGYGDDWQKALEHVKTLYVEPGRQPELIRMLALEAIKFMDDHDLITIPPLARESWRMEMMTPERQLVNPFFTGGEIISVSYPTNTMSQEQKLMSMRGNNIHFSRATVFHELVPGHHLQGYMASRYRPYRSVFTTPFSVEGWSLYWELLLWDMKFQKSPEDRVGALFWHMHRCARIIFSLSFHLGRMTPQECIDMLVKRVGHEPENATAEVRRSFNGTYSPLYQAAYLLGGRQFYALHREIAGSGRMSDRAFHDTVIKENRIPVEMIRAALTQQKLTPDFKSSWRFYDAPVQH
jgi:hypothetical protein